MPPRVYHSEVALGVDLTALTASLLVDALGEGAADGTEVVAEVVHHIDVYHEQGPAHRHRQDRGVLPGRRRRARLGARPRGADHGGAAQQRLRGRQAARRPPDRDPALRQPGRDPRVDPRLADADVHAGDLVTLELRLRDYRGAEHTETLALRVPDDAAEQDIQIEVTGGDNARPPRPMPSSLDDLIDTLQDTYPARSLVATIYREAEGLSTRHGLLPELPASVLESLAHTGSTTSAVRFKQMARRVIPRPALIEGEHTLKLSVRAEAEVRRAGSRLIDSSSLDHDLSLRACSFVHMCRSRRCSPSRPRAPGPAARAASTSATSTTSTPARPRARRSRAPAGHRRPRAGARRGEGRGERVLVRGRPEGQGRGVPRHCRSIRGAADQADHPEQGRRGRAGGDQAGRAARRSGVRADDPARRRRAGGDPARRHDPPHRRQGQGQRVRQARGRPDLGPRAARGAPARRDRSEGRAVPRST